jgi:hypothetical protein
MPSTLHDGWAHLFRDQPRVVADLLRATASADLPVDVSVAPHSNDLGSSRAVELRADGVFRIQHRGADLLGVLSEIQLAIDPDKVFSWPSYVTSFRAALRCGVVLLVFTNDPAVASWARQPISLGPATGYVKPIVFGPEEFPRIRDLDAARQSPELAAISALTHGRDPEPDAAAAIAAAAFQALATLRADRAVVYYDVILAGLSVAARKALEMLPEGYQFLDEGLRRAHADGTAKGKAEGKAEDVLAILETRGFNVSAEQRSRLFSCTDTPTLDRWLRAAVTCADVEALFAH